MVPLAPGFFAGGKPSGYWPYIRDVLIPAGKAGYHFSMGDYSDSSGNYTFNDLASGSYLPYSGSNFPAVYSPSSAGARSVSAGSGPIAGRGYLESTSSTNSTRLATLKYHLNDAPVIVPDNVWFALAFWPTSPQVYNGNRHCILSVAEWFPGAFSRFPWFLYHDSGNLELKVAFNRANDYTPDLVMSCGDMTVGAWNHIVVRWEGSSSPNNTVTVQRDGTKYSTTRSFAFDSISGSGLYGFNILSAVGNGGGASAHRGHGRIAELTWPSSFSPGALITDAQMDALWAAFQTGI